MTLGTAVGLYLVAAALFSVIDVFWYGIVAREYYEGKLADPLVDRSSRAATVVFYALLIALLVWLVIGPAVDAGDLAGVAVWGAVSGAIAFVVWGAYNQLRYHYPRQLFLVEILWGAVLCGGVSAGTYSLWNLFT